MWFWPQNKTTTMTGSRGLARKLVRAKKLPLASVSRAVAQRGSGERLRVPARPGQGGSLVGTESPTVHSLGGALSMLGSQLRQAQKCAGVVPLNEGTGAPMKACNDWTSPRAPQGDEKERALGFHGNHTHRSFGEKKPGSKVKLRASVGVPAPGTWDRQRWRAAEGRGLPVTFPDHNLPWEPTCGLGSRGG